MFGSAIIVFREVLEASLIIGIVLAATQGIIRRSRWIVSGVVAGLVGAAMVAWFADSISGAVQGLGQEIFSAVVLLLAVGMLGWHQIWMSQHGRAMADEFRQLGHSVRSGNRSLYALALVVGLAILREGSEAVLFLFGLATSEGASAQSVAMGAAFGLAGGIASGAALYLGLLRIPPKLLFGVTGWLIILLAAGMASQAAFFLVQAGQLPSLVDQVWDSSEWLSRSSVIGQFLHILIGYDDRPAGIQLLFYVTTILAILGLSRWTTTTSPKLTTSESLRL